MTVSLGKTFETVNPATGEVLETYSLPTKSCVRETLSRARSASGFWQQTAFHQRARLLKRVVEKIMAAQDRLVQQITQETGKPVTDAIQTDLTMRLLQ